MFVWPYAILDRVTTLNDDQANTFKRLVYGTFVLTLMVLALGFVIGTYLIGFAYVIALDYGTPYYEAGGRFASLCAGRLAAFSKPAKLGSLKPLPRAGLPPVPQTQLETPVGQCAGACCAGEGSSASGSVRSAAFDQSSCASLVPSLDEMSEEEHAVVATSFGITGLHSAMLTWHSEFSAAYDAYVIARQAAAMKGATGDLSVAERSTMTIGTTEAHPYWDTTELPSMHWLRFHVKNWEQRGLSIFFGGLPMFIIFLVFAPCETDSE